MKFADVFLLAWRTVRGNKLRTGLTVSIIAFGIMALIGIIIASVVNFFMQSEMLYWLITYAGVLIFVGLTAYDTQKIKNMSGLEASGSEGEAKGAIIGALMLYLDFINLFLFLLRILGDKR